jgi:hypothetical protein
MTNEQIEELVEKMARPIFIYRMAKGDGRKGSEKRIERARVEIKKIIIDLFGPDLEDREE